VLCGIFVFVVVQAKASAEKAAAAAGDDAKKKASAAKAEAKAEAAKAKAKQLEDSYQTALNAANDARKAYVETDLPATLDTFQKLHEERWEQTVSVLKFYTSALSALPSAIEDAVGALKDKIETQASLDEDLAEFIEAAKASAGDAVEFPEVCFWSSRDCRACDLVFSLSRVARV
jgi:colicin import membrane protein